MVAQQREEALRQQEALAEAKRAAAENPPIEKTQADLLEKYKAAEAKQQERNKRLGLEPGKFIYHYSTYCAYGYNSGVFH